MIKFENVTKQYFDKGITTTVLNDINLTIHKGEIIGIDGHSGAGKSTLSRMINGLIPPTKGNIFLDEYSLLIPKTKALIEALSSDHIKNFINTKYQGSVINA